MYTPIGNEFNIIDALFVTIISVAIVFIVLVLIIAISSIFSQIIMKIEKKNKINARIENKLLDEDEDAVVATIVASMEFYNETKTHPRVVGVSRHREE